MLNSKSLYLSLAFLLLAGCATPYKEMGTSGEGVSTSSITQNTWLVSGNSNAATPIGLMQDYVLLKAAEVVTDAGYTHFVIVDKKSRRNTTSNGGLYPVYQGYSEEMTIRALPKNAPLSSESLEAKQVIENIRLRVKK